MKNELNSAPSAKKTAEQLAKENWIAVVSINDLRYRELNGIALTEEEEQALGNYDKYRTAQLNGTISDAEFHKRYKELQVIANLGDYKEFLKPSYF